MAQVLANTGNQALQVSISRVANAVGSLYRIIIGSNRYGQLPRKPAWIQVSDRSWKRNAALLTSYYEYDSKK